MGDVVKIVDLYKNVSVYFDRWQEIYYINPSKSSVKSEHLKLVFKGYLSHKIIEKLKEGKPLSIEHNMYK